MSDEVEEPLAALTDEQSDKPKQIEQMDTVKVVEEKKKPVVEKTVEEQIAEMEGIEPEEEITEPEQVKEPVFEQKDESMEVILEQLEVTRDEKEETPAAKEGTIPEEYKAELKPDGINESVKEIVTQDVLVCGKCHQVYHFVEAFQEHKARDDCKENGELKETLKEDKKPQIWAFTLWKNTKFKDNKEVEEVDKPPTSWSIYQIWRNVDSKEKEVWTKAGENIQSLCDIAHQYETVKISKIRERKAQELLENEEEPKNETLFLNEEGDCADIVKLSKEKDPLGMDSESGPEPSVTTNKKKILKPVHLNNKVTVISRKMKNSRKSARTGSDPKIEHLVEKIVSKRYNPRKKTFEYLIKWENFESEKNTWEPVANLHNCKTMMEEFEKNLQIQKEAQRHEKMLAKKQAKKLEMLKVTIEGRPQRTSKQKALNQVKQWCGNMEADENSGKRLFSDDSDDDDSFEKRMKYEEYSSDSENESPVVTIKRVPKSQNGVEKKPKVESITLPDNILIPDAKGIVRINQKQIPSLSSGVYVMSKTAGIIKLDTKASKLATSGGQTVLKVAPKIGQTSIKVIKKDMANGTTTSTTTTTKTANILRAKPALRNYNSRVYMQKRSNAQNARKVIEAPVIKDEEKDEEESDGIEELEFPTDIPLPAPDSPPPDFTLCPLTGKVLDKDGQVIEEPEPEKTEELPGTSENSTAALDNLVNMAAADILEELQPKIVVKKEDSTESLDNKVPIKIEPSDNAEDQMETSILEPSTTIHSEIKQTDSILSTALTNANIVVRRPPPVAVAHRPQQKTVINRTLGARPGPQAIITRITPGTSPIHRSRVTAPRPKDVPIIRKRTTLLGNHGPNRSLVRRIGDTKVYTPGSSTVQSAQSINSFVATPTSANIVINMPSLIDADNASEKSDTNLSLEGKPQPSAAQLKHEVAEEVAPVPTTSTQAAVSLNSLAMSDSEAPLLITGEDGTIYQVAGQNEDGQTVLITQGEDGEQQCLLVAPENAGLINQALMKPAEPTSEPESAEPAPSSPPAVTEPISINTDAEEGTDDSQVVAQIISANPPSPGGTRKVVLMLPDGNFMMTEVTAEQYAALELDK